MKRLLIIALLIAGCSKDDEPNNDNCNCEQLNFRYTINQAQGQYQEFSRFSCLSFWMDAGYTVENGFIEGPTESTYNNAHNNFYMCN